MGNYDAGGHRVQNIQSKMVTELQELVAESRQAISAKLGASVGNPLSIAASLDFSYSFRNNDSPNVAGILMEEQSGKHYALFAEFRWIDKLAGENIHGIEGKYACEILTNLKDMYGYDISKLCRDGKDFKIIKATFPHLVELLDVWHRRKTMVKSFAAMVKAKTPLTHKAIGVQLENEAKKV
jgi:hypothetical protein